MNDLFVVLGLFGGVVVAIGVLVAAIRRSTGERRTLVAELDERLATALPERRTHLERPPRIRDLVVVDCGGADPPVFVPIVRIDLGTTDAPGMELVFEFVADVLEVIHPILEEREMDVRHYDVQFTFGPDGLLVSGDCRRVSVPPAIAGKLRELPDYRAFDLRRDVERGDDGTDETAPILWSPCEEYADAAAVAAASSGTPTR